MAYETITVRMNRSNASIPWGISIRSGGAGALNIASVERDSLADKACVQVNDTITYLAGRDAKSMHLHEANTIINTPTDEINLMLQRYVTSHRTLPWELNDQDNKVVVDQVRPQEMRSLQGSESRSNQFSSHSTPAYQAPPPNHYDSSNYRSSSYSKFSEEKREGSTIPQYQPAPFSNVTNAHAHDGNAHLRQGFHDSYSTDSHSKTQYHQDGVSSHPGNHPPAQQHQQHFNSGAAHHVPIAVSFTNAPANAPPPHANPPYHAAPQYHPHQDNIVPTNAPPPHANPPYHTVPQYHPHQDNIVPTNAPPPHANPPYHAAPQYHPHQDNIVPTHVDTNYGASFPTRRTPQVRTKSESSYRDDGPHVPFGHSARTRRQLSPNASIQHLQYNSPMNIYSHESAADQYLRQTGGLFGTESSDRVKSIDHHVAATRYSPAIVKPIADRAAPNMGTTYFNTSGGGHPVGHGDVQDPGVHHHAPGHVIDSGTIPEQRPTSIENQARETSQQSPVGRRSRTSSASVHHLQYNSPMNLYSMETAAEQYLKQTGGLFGTDTNPELLKSKDPSYLHSETRRLIAEEEAGMGRRSVSPAQSSSFRRLAVATGTPLQ